MMEAHGAIAICRFLNFTLLKIVILSKIQYLGQQISTI